MFLYFSFFEILGYTFGVTYNLKTKMNEETGRFLKKAAAILSVVLMVSCSVSSEYDYDDKDITTVIRYTDKFFYIMGDANGKFLQKKIMTSRSTLPDKFNKYRNRGDRKR